MKNRYWIIVFAAVIVICSCFWFFTGANDSDTVGIYQDGVLLREIDLSQVDEPYEITVEYNGSRNVIYVESNDIRVIEADCADQVCVDHGPLGDKTPIVCLPNRLMIEWMDNDGEMDAII